MVQKPRLFDLLDLVAGREHIVRLGDPVQEIQSAAHPVVHLLQHPRRHVLGEITAAVFPQSGHGLRFGELVDRDDLQAGRQLLEPLVHPVVVAGEDHGD